MSLTGQQVAHRRVATAFNEWMRRFTETPEEFKHQFEVIQQFLTEQAKGVTPSYGETAAMYLEKLLDEVPFTAEEQVAGFGAGFVPLTKKDNK